MDESTARLDQAFTTGSGLWATEVREAAEADPLRDCWRWLSLPSTEVIQHNIALCRDAIAFIRTEALGATDWLERKAWESRSREWSERLIEAVARDVVQAGRPEGCWCLGTGGTPYMHAGRKFCSCPEGQAAQARYQMDERYLHDEQRERREAEIEERMGLAPHQRDWTFGSFPASPQTTEALRRMLDWAEGKADLCSALLVGPPSRGKTGLAVSALRQRATAELRGGFIVMVADLLEEIRAGFRTRDPDRSEDVFDRVERVTYLVLDDLGKEHQTDWASETLFRLINQRYVSRRPTIFTSNFGLSGLESRLGAWNLDRIVEQCGKGEWVIEIGEQAPNLRIG
jgi:DNA replication protein DnaC